VIHARLLARAAAGNDLFEERLNVARTEFGKVASTSRRAERQALLAAGLLLADLCLQGWKCRIRDRRVEVQPAAQELLDHAAEKQRIRRQELLKRDAQLAQPAAREFIRALERPRMFKGEQVSIFSVMRDGRELAESLRSANKHSNNGWAEALKGVVDPYLQFVRSADTTCSFTGLPLMQMWRYFRHTWSNQHASVPGRSMMFLVRDAATARHSVVGIGSLSSPIVQISVRDRWIGWLPEQFIARLRANPTAALARWLVRVIDKAIREVYVKDFIEEGLLLTSQLDRPTIEVIKALNRVGVAERRYHHRFARAKEHKQSRVSREQVHWVSRARTHLFRSKRALALGQYLRARMVVRQHFGSRATAASLKALVSTSEGEDAIRKMVRKAKADRIGIAVADLSVCGAVQPYNAVLGGKLVAMVAASPEVIAEYGRRYGSAESEIASSMAGRPIVRKPKLVLLGTTSLYSVGSSQYNRIKIPCERLGGRPGELLRYEELGYSEAFGTSQYSEETLAELTRLVEQSADGQRVNSIFGEGVSPKLRKVRAGIDLLGFPSDVLLRHHRRRIVYGVKLIRNLPDYLLGLERRPAYMVSIGTSARSTAEIAHWWRERWLRGRIISDTVLDAVAQHTLVRPIRHGARVSLTKLEPSQETNEHVGAHY
jgi:hypothetical protein